jgi:hypothetical protein
MESCLDKLLEVARLVGTGNIPAYQHNECFTSGAFDSLVLNKLGSEAFDLLSALCERFPSERANGHDLRGFYQLLSQLACQTQTTELPKGMEEIMAVCPQLAGDLRHWYRVSY